MSAVPPDGDRFVEVTGPGLVAVVEPGAWGAGRLAAAADDGLLALLDLLCGDGLDAAPAFGIVLDDGSRLRLLL
ncbi:hypothetical protein, partial [Phycicoccus flavus]